MLAKGMDGISVVTRPWSLGRRIATAALVFLALGFLIAAVAGSNGEGRIAGAGSTLVDPILQRVSSAWQGYLAADRVDVTAREGTSTDWTAGASALDYDPVGSIGGLVRLEDPAISFAATEVPLSAAELEARGLVQFPLILGAAAPVVNLPGLRSLVLDADVLAGIFTGRITRWSDPAIAALNAGVTLSDQPIAVRHRKDGSGTTWTLTGYLSQATAWTAGQVAQADWPVGEAAEGSRGMIDAVKATPGAIGYAEIGQARRAGLTVVDLVGADGAAIKPSAPTIRAALGKDGWTPGAGASLGQAGGWPMTAMVHVVMRADADDAQTRRALAFFRFFYAEAPRRADALGYVALPPDTAAAVEASWASAFNNPS